MVWSEDRQLKRRGWGETLCWRGGETTLLRDPAPFSVFDPWLISASACELSRLLHSDSLSLWSACLLNNGWVCEPQLLFQPPPDVRSSCGYGAMSRGETEQELGPSIRSSLCNVTWGISMKSEVLSYLTAEMWGCTVWCCSSCTVLLNWWHQRWLLYLGSAAQFPCSFFFKGKLCHCGEGKKWLTILLND